MVSFGNIKLLRCCNVENKYIIQKYQIKKAGHFAIKLAINFCNLKIRLKNYHFSKFKSGGNDSQSRDDIQHSVFFFNANANFLNKCTDFDEKIRH